MAVSLHSHSGEFCQHGYGALEEVVKAAVRKKFTTYGLSEHVPRYRTQDLYPEETGMDLQQLSLAFDKYLIEAHRLKCLYSSSITILVGAETEFIDEVTFDRMSKLLEQKTTSIQYLVGSVHHCHQIPIDFDRATFERCLASFEGNNEHEQLTALFVDYFDAQYTLMQRLRPEIIGHFDLCRLYHQNIDFHDFPGVWARIERNVSFAINYGALIELNAASFRKGWSTSYPGPEVVELVNRLNGRFTLSDDAHSPDAVGLNYSKLYEYVAVQNIRQIWCLAEVGKGLTNFPRSTEPHPIEGKAWLKE